MCDKSDEEHIGYLGFVCKSRKLNKVQTNIGKASQLKKKKNGQSRYLVFCLQPVVTSQKKHKQTLSLWIFRVLLFCLQIAITEQSTNNHCYGKSDEVQKNGQSRYLALCLQPLVKNKHCYSIVIFRVLFSNYCYNVKVQTNIVTADF